MKTRLHYFLLLSAIICSCNSTEYVTDGYIGNKNHSRYEAGFSGPVKEAKVTTERIERGTTETDIYCFNEQGDYISLERAIGKVQVNVTYDEMGNKIKETYQRLPAGTLIETNKYKYNEFGQVIQRNRVNTLYGKIENIDNYSYQDTLLIKEFSRENSYVSYKYNEKGLVIERHVFVDRPLQTVFYSYDQNGNLLSTFDDLNNKYKKYHYKNGQIEYVTVEDTNNNIIDRINYSYLLKDGIKTITEAGFKVKTITTYDSYGNIIRKEEFENGTLTYRTTTEITYY